MISDFIGAIMPLVEIVPSRTCLTAVQYKALVVFRVYQRQKFCKVKAVKEVKDRLPNSKKSLPSKGVSEFKKGCYIAGRLAYSAWYTN